MPCLDEIITTLGFFKYKSLPKKKIKRQKNYFFMKQIIVNLIPKLENYQNRIFIYAKFELMNPAENFFMFDKFFIRGFVEMGEFKNPFFLAKSGFRKIPKYLLKFIHNSNRSADIEIIVLYF